MSFLTTVSECLIGKRVFVDDAVLDRTICVLEGKSGCWINSGSTPLRYTIVSIPTRLISFLTTISECLIVKRFFEDDAVLEETISALDGERYLGVRLILAPPLSDIVLYLFQQICASFSASPISDAVCTIYCYSFSIPAVPLPRQMHIPTDSCP